VCIDSAGVSGYRIPVEKELQQASAVVIGTVLSAKPAPEPAAKVDDGTLYQVRVDETLQGAHYKTLDLYSENNSGRFPMDKGRQYLLFVQKNRDILYVDNCGSSGELVESRELVRALRSKIGTKRKD